MPIDEKLVDNLSLSEITATLSTSSVTATLTHTDITATVVDIYEVADVLFDHEGNPILDYSLSPVNTE